MADYATLIIGGIELPLRSLHYSFSQDYEELAGISETRMGDGSLSIQQAWPADGGYKLRTVISGEGRIPAPLAGLRRGEPHLVQCAAQMLFSSATPSVALPSGRRSGGRYDPRGFAVVEGEQVASAITSIVDDVATLTVVADAQHYQVRIYPEFTARLTHRATSQPWQARRGWTLTLDEI